MHPATTAKTIIATTIPITGLEPLDAEIRKYHYNLRSIKHRSFFKINYACIIDNNKAIISQYKTPLLITRIRGVFVYVL